MHLHAPTSNRSYDYHGRCESGVPYFSWRPSGWELAYSVQAQTVTFDFDGGTPPLSRGQSTPIDQTSGGVTARFTSPSGPAFSVQSDASTGFKLSSFSGNYLYDNDNHRNVLDIKFSQPLTSISLNFATADFHQIEVPTTIQLTAYVDSTATAPVGSATAHGTYGAGTMPMGTLTFNSGGRSSTWWRSRYPSNLRARRFSL